MPWIADGFEMLTVFWGSGEEISKAPYSISWTLSREVAEWFMLRHEHTHPGEQHLYRASIAACLRNCLQN